ncbi:histidine--tRNA ligase [Candidatus Gracilibacteria bacterium]|jgi:histidyl-tRNA synthetase|nr:histidine--tRNA ligase [Candidatus Gracilibacteria bacterium]
MKAKARLLSGFLDYMPARMASREEIVRIVKLVYQNFGFVMQSTPCIEYAELLCDKIGEDEKLIYRFKDNGERDVALRYDLTVPLVRIIGTYSNELRFPYRRCQLGFAWRADSPGKGRFREFLQFDADIIGDDSILSDAEVLMIVATIMRKLNFPALIRFNSREILNSLIQSCGLSQDEGKILLRILDKYDKIGKEKVLNLLAEANFDLSVVSVIEEYLSINGDNNQIISALEKLFISNGIVSEGLSKMKKVSEVLIQSGFDQAVCTIDPSIARGLDYYTGLIYETTFLLDPAYGSVCSGGRYDKLIKLPNGEFVPTIGVGFGIDRIFAAMESSGLLPVTKINTDVLVINFDNENLPIYVSIANELRDSGISTLVYPKMVKIPKQFKFSNDNSISITLMLGENEISSDSITLKDMRSGVQQNCSRKKIVQVIKQLLEMEV